jgi:RNA polymerase sigma factor (sigma-70 family)
MSANAPPSAQQIAEALLDQSSRKKLSAYARSRFGIGSDDAEDVLQETAAELLRFRGYVRSPEGFVFTVFRARCVRYANARRLRRGVFDDDQVACEGSVAARPESIDRQVALRQAFNEISSSCRRLLTIYYVEGHSLREAARLVSLQYSSVAKTISRCIKRLRECLT